MTAPAPTRAVPPEILARTAEALVAFRQQIDAEAVRKRATQRAMEAGELEAALLKLFKRDGLHADAITYRLLDDLVMVAEAWGCTWWLRRGSLCVAAYLEDRGGVIAADLASRKLAEFPPMARLGHVFEAANATPIHALPVDALIVRLTLDPSLPL